MNDAQFTSPQETPQLTGAMSYNHAPIHWTFSPVTVMAKETGGVFFLGILTIMLLIALLRALARNHEIEIQLAQRPSVAF